jgi:hypothetical protein
MLFKNTDKTRLKRIAVNQQQLLLCIGLMIIFALMGAYDRYAGDASIFNHELFDIPSSFYYLTNFAAFIFIILLAANVYNSTLLGIINGLLCLIPCFGIIVLVLVNMRATRYLRENGIKVGFFGADKNQFN